MTFIVHRNPRDLSLAVLVATGRGNVDTMLYSMCYTMHSYKDIFSLKIEIKDTRLHSLFHHNSSHLPNIAEIWSLTSH